MASFSEALRENFKQNISKFSSVFQSKFYKNMAIPPLDSRFISSSRDLAIKRAASGTIAGFCCAKRLAKAGWGVERDEGIPVNKDKDAGIPPGGAPGCPARSPGGKPVGPACNCPAVACACICISRARSGRWKQKKCFIFNSFFLHLLHVAPKVSHVIDWSLSPSPPKQQKFVVKFYLKFNMFGACFMPLKFFMPPEITNNPNNKKCAL